MTLDLLYQSFVEALGEGLSHHLEERHCLDLCDLRGFPAIRPGIGAAVPTLSDSFQLGKGCTAFPQRSKSSSHCRMAGKPRLVQAKRTVIIYQPFWMNKIPHPRPHTFPRPLGVRTGIYINIFHLGSLSCEVPFF